MTNSRVNSLSIIRPINLQSLEQVEALSGSTEESAADSMTTTAASTTSGTTSSSSSTTQTPEEPADEQQHEDSNGAPEEQKGIGQQRVPSSPVMLMMGKNASTKSRWLGASKTNSKRPIKASESAMQQRGVDAIQEEDSVPTSTSAKQMRSKPQQVGAKTAGAATTSSNKYIIDDSSNSSNNNNKILKYENDNENAEARSEQPADSSESAPTTTEQSATSFEAQPEFEVMSESTKAREEPRNESEESLAKSKSSNEQRDDDESAGFEAIASAISNTLNSQVGGIRSAAAAAPAAPQAPTGGFQSTSSVPVASSMLAGAALEGDTGLDISAESAGQVQYDLRRPASDHHNHHNTNGFSAAANIIRRRTPGEHVADVIDHIVEQRKHATAHSHHQQHSNGPQIVVVAPVSSHMKARSLTKESAATIEPAASETAKKAASDQLPSPKKVTWSKKDTGARKESSTSGGSLGTKKTHSAKTLTGGVNKPIGARLLGTGESSNASPDAVKYSERVEVIEDDDSSALLMKSPNPDSEQEELLAAADDGYDDQQTQKRRQPPQQQQREEDRVAEESGHPFASLGEQSSIHVSSQPGEARLRSPRHEASASRILERYAPLIQVRADEGQGAGSRARPEQIRAQQQQPAKLYSAEQLIREHVLKSKTKSATHKLTSSPRQQPNTQAEMQMEQPNRPAAQHIYEQVKMMPTTIKPPARASTYQPTTEMPPTTTTSASTTVTATSTPISASTSVPSDFASRNREYQQDQILEQRNRQYFAPSSGIQSVQVPMLTQLQQSSLRQQPQQLMDSQPALAMEGSQQFMQYQPSDQLMVQHQNQHQQQQYHQQQQQQQQQHQQVAPVPYFADQEFNVPAHMAESVIEDIQRSPSAVGMVNGQPTLFSIASQVPPQQQQQQLYRQHHQYPGEAQMMAAASNQMPSHLLSPQQQQQQQHPQMPKWGQSENRQFGAAEMLSRVLTHGQQHLANSAIDHQNHVLANRNSVETAASSQAAAAALSKAPTIRTGGLAHHPVAQMALRHLISSLGQQALQQQAQVDQQQHQPQDPQSRSMAVMPSAGQQPAQLQVAVPDTMQVAGSVPASATMQAPAEFASGNRQMRSLPIGAAPDRQQLGQATEQMEVQESMGGYGPPPAPAYHMGGGGAGYGGGGGGYHNDNDKKSKGITFHFGGGPIGGGTQLITSPMGIFKHLMIPLLPNPRVNLNGKVVFGVVLEKTTAFGSPPKKKHKYFWGR